MISAFDNYYICLDTTYFILFARYYISVVNLEDDESTGQQSNKTTTIFTPKSTGNLYQLGIPVFFVQFCLSNRPFKLRYFHM